MDEAKAEYIQLSFFDKLFKTEKYRMYCKICGEITEHTRSYQGNKETYTCPCGVSEKYTVK